MSRYLCTGHTSGLHFMRLVSCEEAASLSAIECHVHGYQFNGGCAECAVKQPAHAAKQNREAALQLHPPEPVEPMWELRCTGSLPGEFPRIPGCGRVFFTLSAAGHTCLTCKWDSAREVLQLEIDASGGRADTYASKGK